MKERSNWHPQITTTYTCIEPSGKRHTVVDLALFCRAYRLNYSQMVSVANGWMTDYKGWICLHGEL